MDLSRFKSENRHFLYSKKYKFKVNLVSNNISFLADKKIPDYYKPSEFVYENLWNKLRELVKTDKQSRISNTFQVTKHKVNIYSNNYDIAIKAIEIIDEYVKIKLSKDANVICNSFDIKDQNILTMLMLTLDNSSLLSDVWNIEVA